MKMKIAIAFLLIQLLISGVLYWQMAVWFIGGKFPHVVTYEDTSQFKAIGTELLPITPAGKAMPGGNYLMFEHAGTILAVSEGLQAKKEYHTSKRSLMFRGKMEEITFLTPFSLAYFLVPRFGIHLLSTIFAIALLGWYVSKSEPTSQPKHGEGQRANG